MNESPIKEIKACFNKAAKTYDDYSGTQQIIGNNLITALHQYPLITDSIIDLGCGTGIVTEKLAAEFKYKRFYAVDIADQLLSVANDRLISHGIKILNTDFNHLNYKDIKFNLAFSNMALHWSHDIKHTLKSIYNNICSGGFIAFSLPLQKTFLELPFYSKNKFYTSYVIKRLLADIQFQEIAYFEEILTLNFDSLIVALKTIKAVGANYVFDKRKINSQALFKLIKCRNKQFNLTYHIGYFIAKKYYDD